MKEVAIIGGGAAGCFAAAELSRLSPGRKITVYEAGPALMAKLSITGGGRCNFTNTFENVRSLKEVYTRGYNLMKGLLYGFGPEDIREWMRREGLSSVVEDEDKVFPECQSAAEVVRALRRAMQRGGVRVECGRRIDDVRDVAEPVKIVATGGGALKLLEPLGLEVEKPVPSLFTFKITNPSLTALSGTVLGCATLSIPGTSFRAGGALLITDWGLSGPAALALSSRAARYLAGNEYRAPLSINWLGLNQQEALELCRGFCSSRAMVLNERPRELTSRLWGHICAQAGLRDDIRWAEIGSRGLNLLAEKLSNDVYTINGRARFKEEFVTAGGVSLAEVDQRTLESKKYPGLYFAGEVLDVDAVTGGFNLQAAWSTAEAVARAIASKE